MTPYECSGGCGLVMSGPDMWCSSCWPKNDRNVKPNYPVRFVVEGRLDLSDNAKPKDAS